MCVCVCGRFVVCKQKTAYEMRISDWSSDVGSSDLLERQPIEQGDAGDIVAISGLSKATVADTICDPAVDAPIPAQPIDPPTLAMTFSVNDSPLAGPEGDKVTSRVIRDTLLREAEDRQRAQQGQSASVRVKPGGRRTIKTTKQHKI